MCLAVPGEVLSIEGADPVLRKGKVQFGGIKKDVSLVLTPEAEVGDYVLVHAGIAISVVDPEEAERVFAYLDEIGELEELEEGAR